MTTATARTRTRPRRTPDLSYLLSRSFKENPDFLLAAVGIGGFISCMECHRVVGVGSSEETAAINAVREGDAVKAGNGYVCIDHAEETK